MASYCVQEKDSDMKLRQRLIAVVFEKSEDWLSEVEGFLISRLGEDFNPEDYGAIRDVCPYLETPQISNNYAPNLRPFAIPHTTQVWTASSTRRIL